MAKKALGKGLDSLLGMDDIPEIISPQTQGNPMELALTDIEPNRDQPRKAFDKEKIDALAASIKEQGLIQPIAVCKMPSGRYMIVAGERRWRAAKKAGLKKVPVVIKDYTPAQIAQAALVENLQREDLNPIEEAQGYRSLMEEYSMTQEAVSAITGKSRSAIANSTRLLALEKEYQKLLQSGELSGGHARALLSIEGAKRKELCDRIIAEGLNVRQAEALAKNLAKAAPKKKKTSSAVAAQIRHLEEELSSQLGTKVKIIHTAKKGRIEIEYFGNEDLDRILSLITK